MAAAPAREPGLKRSLSVWQAVGLSMALMAPSMAANINPQGAIGAGRAVPLAFLIAAFGVLLVAYTFVRLCQYSGIGLGVRVRGRDPRAAGGRDRRMGAGGHLHVLRGDDRGGRRDLRHWAA